MFEVWGENHRLSLNGFMYTGISGLIQNESVNELDLISAVTLTSDDNQRRIGPDSFVRLKLQFSWYNWVNTFGKYNSAYSYTQC